MRKQQRAVPCHIVRTESRRDERRLAARKADPLRAVRQHAHAVRDDQCVERDIVRRKGKVLFDCKFIDGKILRCREQAPRSSTQEPEPCHTAEGDLRRDERGDLLRLFDVQIARFAVRARSRRRGT